jgi:DNA-binding CsgD family transcriptional regulator
VRRALGLSRLAHLLLRGPTPDLERARRLFAEALTLSRSVDHASGVAAAAIGLGEVARRKGDLAAAAAHDREALAIQTAFWDPWGIAMAFEALGRVALEAGAADQGASLFGAAARLRGELALPVPAPARPAHEAAIARMRTVLGEGRFTEAWEAGGARGLEEVIAAAEAWAADFASAPAAAPANRTDAAGLSPREREVLRLLAAGTSDREIAEALSISYRTVTNHVASILAKLDVSSRAAAAALAVRRGLA